MAMYPCLSLPSLSFPSVSGAVCSFDSQYAGLPLKSHTVDVNAVQSGSGTPSPDNVRSISGWNAITITANSVPTVIQIGSTVYGGTYDARTGLFTCNWAKANTSTMNWNISATGLFASSSLVGIIKNNTSNYTPSPYIKCSAFECVDSYGITGPRGTTPSPNGVFAENTTGVVYFNLTSETTIEGFKAFMSDKQFIYELATPTTIQLPPCPIDTLLGQNNIFADTGDTTLQYIKLG